MDVLIATAPHLGDVLRWVKDTCGHGRIASVGVDTLTEWSTGRSGFRLAYRWLQQAYPEIAGSVVCPNALYGAMANYGAAFLISLAESFGADGTMVTEAHPKVCYYALTGRKPRWTEDGGEMVRWLGDQLAAQLPAELSVGSEHGFDAAMSALAALRGLNRDWTLDLHALPGSPSSDRVHFRGQSHYWWPPETLHNVCAGPRRG